MDNETVYITVQQICQNEPESSTVIPIFPRLVTFIGYGDTRDDWYIEYHYYNMVN